MHGFIGRLYFSFSGIFPVGWGHTYEEFTIKQARFCFIETKTRILKVYVYISGAVKNIQHLQETYLTKPDEGKVKTWNATLKGRLALFSVIQD